MRLIVLLFAAALIAWGAWTLVAREEVPGAAIDEAPPAAEVSGEAAGEAGQAVEQAGDAAESAGEALRDAADTAVRESGDALEAAGEAASDLAGDAVEAGRAAADAVGEEAGELRREIESLVDEATEPEPAPPSGRSGQLRPKGPAATPAPSLQPSASTKRAMRSQASARVASDAA